MSSAINNIGERKHLLPERVSLFAINAMAPMWLTFLEAISQHTQVHFFHLNPCFDYWGDILTEKAYWKKLSQWTHNSDKQVDSELLSITESIANPLLANLGQQGREFMALLQSVSTIDVEAFEHQTGAIDDTASVLADIQSDILSLADKRTEPITKVDDSIVITSAHSALREVQGLHDWLLHQFNQDPELTPKDVLVMCPQIEDYAPYVNAVFARGWQDIDEGIPPLPCSIADRSAKDADPIVSAYMDLLSLPDSRFQVSQIYALLKLPAVHEPLGLTEDDVNQIAVWLEKAGVHWGLDAEHKNRYLKGERLTSQYTWEQGLNRLLQGFMYSDTASIQDDLLLIPDVEGQQAEVLGKLMLFIEHLSQYVVELSSERTATQWQVYLTKILTQSFAANHEQSINIISNAISSLGEYTAEARFDDTIALPIVIDFLNAHFSEPDTSRQFMVGQVTFCSMLPMRSIPFKIIAIMGLNDGQFPRQRNALAFDLMAQTSSKLGDRSRRGDDRYLFLEAIISARKALYLSYQGRSIKNNTPKQPSIVLNELCDYLTQAYGWCFDEVGSKQLRCLPMQPFSERNYIEDVLVASKVANPYPSFDANWLNLIATPVESISSAPRPESVSQVSSGEMIKFFMHPSKYYANTQLNLYFEQYETELNDDEPFVADSLAAYQLREDYLNAYLTQGTLEQSEAVNNISEVATLSGQYADTPNTQLMIESWQQDSKFFAEQVLALVDNIKPSIPETLHFDHRASTTQLNFSLPVQGEHLVYFRSSTPKAKDIFTLYLHQLFLQLLHQQDCYKDVKGTLAKYFNTKSQKVVNYQVNHIENPDAKLSILLDYFAKGSDSPLLLNAALADKLIGSKPLEQSGFEHFWQGDRNTIGFGQDPYIAYFWPQCPEIASLIPEMTEMYQAMLETVVGVK